MRLGQIVGRCTLKYTVWRRQKIEDAVPLPVRMQVSNPTPIQPSEVEIVLLEFAFERLEIEQEYLRL